MKKPIASFKFHAFISTIILFFSGCIHKKSIDKQKLYITHAKVTTDTPSSCPPPVSIWVHGTAIFRKSLYHTLFAGKACLRLATTLPEHNHLRIIAETIAEQDQHSFPLEEFYIFGWSGHLHNQARKNAAESLYNEIIQLCIDYQKKYTQLPVINIFAHSHGGNVVLNMALIKNNITPFSIEALILLACPVQDETMHLINTPIFKHVYSLYSSFDIVQVLAPQFKRSHRVHQPNAQLKRSYNILPFSARTFPDCSHLTQTKIKINHHPIGHTTFTSKGFVALLPTILRKLEEWHQETQNIGNYCKQKLLCIFKNKTI